ncbi:Uncharacterised protein [Klebsiella pneumoniae]|nr:Uncharacterised protein [Klebsiella pneumoniae]
MCVNGVQSPFQWIVNFCIFKRTDTLLPVCIQKICPPLQHKPTFFQMFCFMNIRGTYSVALLMTHLTFNRIS